MHLTLCALIVFLITVFIKADNYFRVFKSICLVIATQLHTVILGVGGWGELPCWTLKLIVGRIWHTLTLGLRWHQYHVIKDAMKLNAESYVYEVWDFHSRLKYSGSWHCSLGNENCDNTFFWNNGYHLQDYT